MDTKEFKMLYSSPMENVLGKQDSEFHPVTLPVSSTQEGLITADAASNENLNFSVKGLKGMLVDRCFILNYTVTVVVVSAADTIDLNESDFALASCPLMRCTKSMDVTLNNDSRSYNVSMFNSALRHFHSNDDQMLANSAYPRMPDRFNNVNCNGQYSDGGTSAIQAFADTPLDRLNRFSRASFKPVSVTYGGTGNRTATVVYDCHEPLVHPFFSDNLSRDCFGLIDSIDVKMNFLSSLLPMVTIGKINDSGTSTTPASVTVSITSNTPTISYRRYKPSVNLPPQLSMPWTRLDIKPFVANDGATAGATDGTFDTGNMVLSKVPERFYVYVAPKNDYSNYNQADAFASIQTLEVRLDTGVGLTNAKPVQLHQMSVRNGSKQSFDNFNSEMGSIICIDLPSGDLGTDLIPGSQTSFNIQFSGTFHNTTYSQIDKLTTRSGTTNQVTAWRLIVIPLYHEIMIADGDAIELNHGGFTQDQAISAVAKVSNGEEESLRYDEGEGHDVKNGGWYRSLHRSLGRVSHAIQKGIDIAPKVIKKFEQGKDSLDALQRLTSGGTRVYG